MQVLTYLPFGTLYYVANSARHMYVITGLKKLTIERKNVIQIIEPLINNKHFSISKHLRIKLRGILSYRKFTGGYKCELT